jgi:hypothetical protein
VVKVEKEYTIAVLIITLKSCAGIGHCLNRDGRMINLYRNIAITDIILPEGSISFSCLITLQITQTYHVQNIFKAMVTPNPIHCLLVKG